MHNSIQEVLQPQPPPPPQKTQNITFYNGCAWKTTKMKMLKVSHITITEKSLIHNLSYSTKIQSSGIIDLFSEKTKWQRKEHEKYVHICNHNYFRMVLRFWKCLKAW